MISMEDMLVEQEYDDQCAVVLYLEEQLRQAHEEMDRLKVKADAVRKQLRQEKLMELGYEA